MKKVIIIGAGGHAKVVSEIVKLNGYEIIGFLDDNKDSKLFDYKYLGKISRISEYTDSGFVLAIGNNIIRKKLMTEHNADWITVIHPDAVLSENVEMGNGTVVMAGAVINCDTKIGNGCIINTSSSIDHDCDIADYVHVSPGVNVAGTVKIGSLTWLGIGSTIINNVNVCSNCFIGAGAVVVKNINEEGTYIGIPARSMTK